MSRSTLLWLLVAYRNLDQVDDFVDALRALPGSDRFSFAICDNSPTSGVSRHSAEADTVFLSRPDNPGYLEGALLGLDAYRDRGGVPDWVTISNTDLDFVTGNPIDALERHDSAVPLVLGPRITEGASLIEKNPHVLERRSLGRLRANAAATWTPPMAMLYQVVSLARWTISSRRGTTRHDPEAWAARCPAGTHFYSPYGAVIFFSHGFFEAGGLPRDVPLLSEEYFVAEAAADAGAEVLYEPRIHAHHAANITTGRKVTLSRARRTSHAFKIIYRDAASRQAHGG